MPASSRALWMLLLFCAFLLAGCWDRKAVEDVGFVTVLGIDQGEGEALRITVQIGNPRVIAGGRQGGGGAEGQQAPAMVHTVTGETLSLALRDLETFTNRRISLVQTRVIILGRRLMESGIQKHLGMLVRSREFRRNIQIMVSDGSAEQVMTTRPTLERDPAVFLEDLSRRAFERTARAPRITLHDFLLAYETLGEEVIAPIIRPFTVAPGLEQRPEQQSQLSGTALFRRGTMVGELSETETETLLMLRGKTETFVETVPVPTDPGLKSAYRLTGAGRKIRLDVSGPQPRFTIEVTLEAEALETESESPALGDPALIRDREARLARNLTDKANQLVGKLQTECSCDALGLGHYLRPRFLDWTSWEKYQWPDRFANAKVQVTVRVIIRRVGMTFQSQKAR